MSFSVEAKEFVPSFAAMAWGGGKAAIDHISSSSTRSGAAYSYTTSTQPLKERVCMACYECGKCPFGDACAHAHHFAELSPDAQTKLLMTVSVESIPSRFLSNTTSPSTASSSKAAAGGAASGLTPYARGPSARPCGILRATTTTTTTTTRSPHSPHNMASLRSGPRLAQANDGFSLSPFAFETASQSSHDSSSHAGSPRGTMVSLPPTLDTFRMHLPARCRYPHAGIVGTYYSFLGVARTAKHEEIVAKYRLWHREAFKRMRAVDPIGAEAADRIIVEARNVLGNPVLRAEYDRSLSPAQAPTTSSLAITNTTTTTTTTAKWASAALPPQATPASMANTNNVSSSVGTSSRTGGGHRHGGSLSSSVSSTGSGCGGTSSSPNGNRAPSSGNSLCGRASPVLTLTSNTFADDIW